MKKQTFLITLLLSISHYILFPFKLSASSDIKLPKWLSMSQESVYIGISDPSIDIEKGRKQAILRALYTGALSEESIIMTKGTECEGIISTNSEKTNYFSEIDFIEKQISYSIKEETVLNSGEVIVAISISTAEKNNKSLSSFKANYKRYDKFNRNDKGEETFSYRILLNLSLTKGDTEYSSLTEIINNDKRINFSSTLSEGDDICSQQWTSPCSSYKYSHIGKMQKKITDYSKERKTNIENSISSAWMINLLEDEMLNYEPFDKSVNTYKTLPTHIETVSVQNSTLYIKWK